jgi:hypothetical protein
MDRSSPKLVQILIGTMGKSYGGRRSRVRIDVRAALHIQYRRPNGCADRGPNWCKHSFEQWAEFIVIGGRECALMCALRAQTCAYHYTSSISGQTAGPIGAQIGTNTHCNNAQKLWRSAVASAHLCARSARKHARRITHLPRARSSSVGRAQRACSVEQKKLKLRNRRHRC